jgi:hypothetical protein
VPSYLVETYLSHADREGSASRVGRARSAAEELTRQRVRVRFAQSIHVPEDEICFFVFEAPSRRVAVLAARRAGLEPIRIVEAIASREEER